MRARFPLGSVRSTGLLLAVLCGLLPAFAPTALAQETRPDSVQADSVRTDPAQADSVQAAPAPGDTTQAGSARADSARADSARGGPPGPGGAGAGAEAPENAVQFSARDSLVMTFGEGDDDQGGDVGRLYGAAEVNYQEATLTAYEVRMLMSRQELQAIGPPEDADASPDAPSDTAGLPRFQRGEGEAFTGSELSFNMETKRGRVVKARTSFQEGYVEGQAVRVDEDSTLYVRGGRYTTCNCPRGETPSYSMRSSKMKVQGKWVYTGPIQLFIFNIPMPFVLPFAFLPATSGRRGGIIPPSYGNDDRRGLYLRNFGYYWPVNDYMDLQVTGSLWSRGSWGLSPQFRYARRYEYDGNLGVDYTRNIAGDVVDSDYLNRTSAAIRWSHRQDFNPTMSLNANVDLASETQRRVISEDFNDNVTQRTSSSINFSKSWAQGNRDLDVTLSQRQNLSDGSANLTLPRLSFSQSSLKPFARDRRGPGEDERWYERIRTSYTGRLDNNFRFNPADEEELRAQGDTTASGITWYNALFSPSAYRRATGDEGQRFDFSATHNIPVSASFRVPRYDLSITPNLNYSEEWFISTERREVRASTRVVETDESGSYRVDPERTSSVVTREVPGFFAAREMRAGVSTSTTFYGLFPLRAGPLEGLRHTVQPNLSFNYQPDYNADFFGRTRAYTDPETGEEVRYDITDGGIVRGSRAQSNVSFGVDNVFETKQVSIDSTGAEESETLRLMRLSVNSSYNFAADSLRLSDFRARMRFPVLQSKFDVNANLDLTLSPYSYNEEGRRINRLVLSESGLLPAQLTSFDVSVRTDFQSGDGNAGRSSTRSPTGAGFGAGRTGVAGQRGPRGRAGRVAGRRSPLGPDLGGQYANFAIPWSLGVRFSYGFTNRGQFEGSSFLVNTDFDFNLTPRWKVSGRSGYDFSRGELTATRLNITRDFDCWQMNFNWTPFGPRQSYGFNLRVKSSMLGDLLNLRLPRQGVRGRFSGAVSQVASQATQ